MDDRIRQAERAEREAAALELGESMSYALTAGAVGEAKSLAGALRDEYAALERLGGFVPVSRCADALQRAREGADPLNVDDRETLEDALRIFVETAGDEAGRQERHAAAMRVQVRLGYLGVGALLSAPPLEGAWQRPDTKRRARAGSSGRARPGARPGAGAR